MKILNDEIVYNGEFIRTIRRHFSDKDGKEKMWELIERKTFGRVVVVAAITEKREIILEKIFRVPFKAHILELPAGLMDKKGETEEEAVRRELLEETGFAVDEVELLIAGPYNQGIVGEDIAIYLGTNAKFVQAPRLESSEDIEVVKVPTKNLLDYITKSRIKADVKIAAAIPFLEKKGLLI